MTESTDIKTTLVYGKNNKERPYFYAYQRSDEERKQQQGPDGSCPKGYDKDFGGETVHVEVTGLFLHFLLFTSSKMIIDI